MTFVQYMVFAYEEAIRSCLLDFDEIPREERPVALAAVEQLEAAMLPWINKAIEEETDGR